MMNKGMMWGVVVVALVVGLLAGYLFEKQRSSMAMESAKMMMQKQLDQQKMQADQLQNDKMMLEKSLTATPSPSGAMMKK